VPAATAAAAAIAKVVTRIERVKRKLVNWRFFIAVLSEWLICLVLRDSGERRLFPPGRLPPI
jgi:hypothetical protein